MNKKTYNESTKVQKHENQNVISCFSGLGSQGRKPALRHPETDPPPRDYPVFGGTACAPNPEGGLQGLSPRGGENHPLGNRR